MICSSQHYSAPAKPLLLFAVVFAVVFYLLEIPAVAAAAAAPAAVYLRHEGRATLDISVGIGVGGSNDPPAPAPTKCGCTAAAAPSPSDFLNEKQHQAYLVIQRFKSIITCDPTNATATWFGPRPCSYLGFYCAASPESPDAPSIYSVDFNGFRLCAPSLSGFLDALPDLSLFHANSNSFAGTVPDLTSLNYLYELDLSNNLLSGPFPSSSVLPIGTLTFLDLRFNRFSGDIPAGSLSPITGCVDALFLNNNLFSGQIPADLLWPSNPAAYLTLANNRFTGRIPQICAPSTAGSAPAETIEILLLGNQLSGCLPPEIGPLLREARVFDAGSNRITGGIPASFGCLDRVEQLNLAGNRLYGEVPDEVCLLSKSFKLGRLANLSLSGNYFTSVGISCLALVEEGKLDVRRNCIPGLPEQRPLEDCVRFLLRPPLCPPSSSSFVPCDLQAPEVIATPAAGNS